MMQLPKCSGAKALGLKCALPRNNPFLTHHKKKILQLETRRAKNREERGVLWAKEITKKNKKFKSQNFLYRLIQSRTIPLT